jgi:hypothetical protein
MATGTSSRLSFAVALVAALGLASCGGAARPPAREAIAHAGSGFAWLRPAHPPVGWRVGRLPSHTAQLAYPPSWRAIRTDPGTFSAALLGPHNRIRGYLNITPRSGPETAAGWASFRPAHNREEGDRAVVRDAAAVGLPFPSGHGSCVMDHYATALSRYNEIACLVSGSHSTTVVVGAAPPNDWARVAPTLERSIASFSN